MDFKILKVSEKNNSLVIEVECAFGKDKFGLGLHQKYLDPETGEPRYLGEVKDLLESRYGADKVKTKEVDKKNWGKTFST